MVALKYKVIKNDRQYFKYCDELESLLEAPGKSKSIREEIELLTFLIEKWDEEHNTLKDSNPVELLEFLMDEHSLKASDLATILHVSKSLISDILHYKKGFSKEVIRRLSAHFKLNQEAFNRPYKLKLPINPHIRDTRREKPVTKKAA